MTGVRANEDDVAAGVLVETEASPGDRKPSSRRSIDQGEKKLDRVHEWRIRATLGLQDSAACRARCWRESADPDLSRRGSNQ